MNPVCLLTGISGGIGQATARQLAERGVQVIGVARNADRGRAAVKKIRDRAPAAQVELMIADLSQLDEVRRLAEEVRFSTTTSTYCLTTPASRSTAGRPPPTGTSARSPPTTWRPIC